MSSSGLPLCSTLRRIVAARPGGTTVWMIRRSFSTQGVLHNTVHLGGQPATPPPQDWQTKQAEEKAYNDFHKDRLGYQDYTHYQHWNYKHRTTMQKWITAGPPPLSDYRLTFGKHKGKRLDEVPDSYMVKYLIPGRKSGLPSYECPLVIDAVEDFMKRHPDLTSQAGPARTQPIKGGVLKPASKRRSTAKSSIAQPPKV